VPAGGFLLGDLVGSTLIVGLLDFPKPLMELDDAVTALSDDDLRCGGVPGDGEADVEGANLLLSLGAAGVLGFLVTFFEGVLGGVPIFGVPFFFLGVAGDLVGRLPPPGGERRGVDGGVDGKP
jgi:hypothetical protein